MLEFYGVVLALDGGTLYLELLESAGNLIELLRYGVALHTQLGCSLIHKVYGLVGEEPLGDVTVGEFHGGYHGLIHDTHLVVVLIPLLKSTQYGYGALHVGFIDHDGLETAFQGLVLFKVLLILVQGGGTYGAQITAGQGRLENVGGIHGALAGSGTHQSVYLIYEQDVVSVGLDDLVDYALETLLKFTFVLGTGHEGTHVERIYCL